MRKDALAFASGVIAIQFAPALPPDALFWVWGLPLAGLLAWWTPSRWIAFGVLGAAFTGWRADLNLQRALPSHFEGRVVTARVKVDSLVRRLESDDSFEAVLLDSSPAIAARRLRIAWIATPRTPHAAEIWRFTLKVRPCRGLRNPGVMDTEGLLYQQGIDALASVQPDTPAVLVALPGLDAPLLRTREKIAGRLSSWLAGSPSAGVVIGLAVGDSSRVDAGLWETFRALGITHLMAISGSHVGLLGAFVAWLIRHAWSSCGGRSAQRPSIWIVAPTAALASCLYALIAGFSVPTQRTAWMIALACAARLSGRAVAASDVLALALVGVLILDPGCVLQPGFWLSFGTVAWIFMFMSGRAEHAAHSQHIVLQTGVSLVLLPITLVCFSQASLIGPLVNLVAVPFTEMLLVPCILAAVALIPIAPSVAQWVLVRLSTGLDSIWPVFDRLAELPHAQWWAPHLALVLAPLGVLAAVAVCLVPSLAWKSIGLSGLVGLALWRGERLQPAQFDAAVLDVGAGLATVVHATDFTLLYYAAFGPMRGANPSASVILPYLRAQGIDHLDVLILSHVDGSHAAGIEGIFRGLPVLQTFGGGDVRAPCLAGQRFDRGPLAIRVLSPAPSTTPGSDASCVVWVGSPAGSMLLPGDAPSAVEETLASQRALLPVDVVVAPRHGDAHASSISLVDATQPRWVLVSCAHANRFGYPRPETVKRWSGVGAEVLETADEGALTVRFRGAGAGVRVLSERKDNPRIWSADRRRLE